MCSRIFSCLSLRTQGNPILGVQKRKKSKKNKTQILFPHSLCLLIALPRFLFFPAAMSQLFRRPSSNAPKDTSPADPISGYSSLLNPVSSIEPVEQPRHHYRRRRRHTGSSSAGWPSLGMVTGSGSGGSHQDSRPWLSAVEARPSWTGERPPARKLVKEPGSGSARPSFSVELSDSDDEKDKGFLRRSFGRLKDLYRRSM